MFILGYIDTQNDKVDISNNPPTSKKFLSVVAVLMCIRVKTYSIKVLNTGHHTYSHLPPLCWGLWARVQGRTEPGRPQSYL